jgi:hypothetical protein
MTDTKKTAEDLLGEYTDDLLADRRPRLREELAALDDADRADVTRLADLVRQVKAAHTETPPPSAEFLSRLEATVATEIAARGAAQAPAPYTPPRARPGREAGRRPLDVVAEFLIGWRWPLAGCAVVAVLLMFQVQVAVQVQRLQRENRDLSTRLERLAAPERMVPLGLPVEIGLRLRIEERIEELDKELAGKTGEARRPVERAIQELKALLRSPQGK